ncbi:hypothetical protein E1A91_A11G117000v1 [Gossypium mustelinum]|uniref:Uncharacterized protein n=3 Tax=Gossypium TaxID=3633 RepID=A0A5D2X4R2_GOSMU|nr:hypothetical protein ES288_A11G121300v1 [Gossypium darwinii]TYI00238.1 hypothetical protein ES332_A11G119500v1 [Gossypium tomentosum]TYJ09088.1 hypothetical protein E1A91_A11G117000v1 [Gossypium mustelinum]
MASDESMTVVSSMPEDELDDIDVGFDHDHHPHPHNLSRLSMCTSSMYEDEDDDDRMGMYMSRLSMESFDADVEEEFFSKELLELSSDSDKEPGCYSLPASPPRRNPTRGLSQQLMEVVKDYASENEALKGGYGRPKGSKNLRKRRVIRERWAGKESKNSGKKKDMDFMVGYSYYSGSFSGESEAGSAGVVVITRPKGGKRSLCMDLEEVKACRDLGFELEHELMLEMPSASRVSLSGSTLDTTSSGGNSPIANWRISSPGDDPRDVKARLKVWAQAVALASSSRHCG